MGEKSMNVVSVMGPEKDVLGKAELKVAEKAKLAIEKNKLILEKVLVPFWAAEMQNCNQKTVSMNDRWKGWNGAKIGLNYGSNN